MTNLDKTGLALSDFLAYSCSEAGAREQQYCLSKRLPSQFPERSEANGFSVFTHGTNVLVDSKFDFGVSTEADLLLTG
jgi:hypothetical protein